MCFLICCPFRYLIETVAKLAEIVGSTPTRSISFFLVNYGITLSSISIIVGQKPGDDAMQYYAVCR
ncbi:MAG: hypothetical protein ACREAS_04410, partial [Nitrososphaera sp.]